jgi:hypothetical protein
MGIFKKKMNGLTLHCQIHEIYGVLKEYMCCGDKVNKCQIEVYPEIKKEESKEVFLYPVDHGYNGLRDYKNLLNKMKYYPEEAIIITESLN